MIFLFQIPDTDSGKQQEEYAQTDQKQKYPQGADHSGFQFDKICQMQDYGNREPQELRAFIGNVKNAVYTISRHINRNLGQPEQEFQEAGGTIENVSESSHSNPSFVLTFYAICHRLIYADGVPIQRSHLFLNILPERISPIGLHSIVWFYLSCYPGDFQNCHREKTNKIFLVKPHCLQR